MKFNNKFLGTAFTLSGNIIGAGILGLPFVFSQAGFFIGLFWLVIIGAIMLYLFLCLGEVALRTKAKLQLIGYTEKYLGKKWKILMFFSVLFGVYSALLAYLIGEGQSLSYIFTGSVDYAVYFACGFWLLMTLLLREGLRGFRKISTYGVLGVIGIILLIAVLYLPRVQSEYIYAVSPQYFFLPFGVILFALMGFNSIPELEMIIKGSEKKFKKAIILGVLIPIILYAIFSFTIVGAFEKIPEVATIGLGKLFTLLGILTMFTAYFTLSFALKDVYRLDLKCSKKMSYLLMSIVPLLIYLLLHFFNRLSFISILGIGGVVSGGITAIMILLMNRQSKKLGDRRPEYVMSIHWLVISILSLIFILGMVREITG
ncbi:MAG: hypothetical protein RL557_906 [archaeon]|jgi:amino acid permease